MEVAMLVPEPTGAEVADIVAINHLAVSYAEAMSRLEIDEAVLAYTADGVLASPTTDDAVGRAAIAATIRTATANFEFLFQTVHNGLVRVDGDRATARFPITEWGRRRDTGLGQVFLGFYEDDAVRTNEGWRFARRELVPLTLGRAELFKGRVMELAGLRPSL
jgi:ketosteroid isomerase-like protein